MQIIQSLLDGLLLGGVYGVIAIGLSLVFGVVGIVNFAHAQFLMIGMYIAYFCWKYLGLDPMFGCLFSLLGGFAIGWAIQHTMISRVLKASHSSQIFLTVGILIVLENLALMLFGSEFQSVQTVYQTMSLQVGPYFFSAPYVFAFIWSALVSILLWLFLEKTWTGNAIRATAQNAMAATLMGINTKTAYGIAFGLGCGLTAFGGGVILPYLTVSPTVGEQFVVLMFTVVVLGGLGSVVGALVGGVLVGIIQSVSALYFPLQLQNLVLFVVFIMVLAFRPQGILKGL